MKTKAAFTCASLFCFIFGLLSGGLTQFTASLFDIELNEGGIFVARIFGAALLGFSAVFLYARNESHSEARHSIIIGEAIHSGIAAIIWIEALIRGFGNLLILIPLLGHLGLAIWFWYIAIKDGGTLRPISKL